MRVRLCDLRTGRRILDIPFLSASWTSEINTAESVSAKVDLNDRRIRRLGLYNASWPGRTALIVEDEHLSVGGPIWTRRYDRDEGTLELTGKGLWSYFDYRTLLPLMADTDNLVNPDGTANTAFDTNLTAMSYETIAKRWIQQSMRWTGGDLPIVFQEDVPGTYRRNVKGAELKLIGDMLTNLTGVENGPDIRFQPRRQQDGLGYEWMFICGHPRITSTTVTKWDASVSRSPVTGLVVEDDASNLASIDWQTGGASSDQAIIERAVDHGLTDAGFPLYERAESLSSSVIDQQTALRHASESLRTSRIPQRTWSFDVRRDHRLGIYDAGYPASVKTRGDPYGIPDGWHPVRIMTLQGSSDGDDIQVRTGVDYG